MSRQTDAEEIYQIAKDASGPIPLSDLKEMIGYGSSRGAATRVSSAYWYYDGEGDAGACEMIARTFVDRNGHYAWWM